MVFKRFSSALLKRSVKRCFLSKNNLSTVKNGEKCNPESFAFSGCGWLLPFHLGVVDTLQKAAIIDKNTKFAGTSGGSLAGLIACSGMPIEQALSAIIANSKSESFKDNIDLNMKAFLKQLMPSDILEKCNDKLFITTTKLWPKPSLSPTITSQFEDQDHLIETVAASCFIPLYSGTPLQLITKVHKRVKKTTSTTQTTGVILQNIPTNSPTITTTTTKTVTTTNTVVANKESSAVPQNNTISDVLTAEMNMDKGYFIDGGVFAFMPPIGEVRVAPVHKRMRKLLGKRYPQVYLEDDQFTPRQLLYWALNPPKEERIYELFAKGQQAAEVWMKKREKGSDME